MSAAQTEIVQRIPIHWAVTLVVLFALPFGFFLDKYNFTLWVCFIVWAEYFALGAVPKNARLIFPSIPFGAAIGKLNTKLLLFVTSGSHGTPCSFRNSARGSLTSALTVRT